MVTVAPHRGRGHHDQTHKSARQETHMLESRAAYRRRLTRSSTLLLFASAAAGACSGGMDSTTGPQTASALAASAARASDRDDRGDRAERTGAVYTLTNAAGGNGVVAFTRA